MVSSLLLCRDMAVPPQQTLRSQRRRYLAQAAQLFRSIAARRGEGPWTPRFDTFVLGTLLAPQKR